LSGWLKNIFDKVKELSSSVDTYKKDTVIQSLPSLASVNRAKKLLEKQKYDEAEAILLKALELPQQDPLVYKYLGAVYEKIGKHELAVDNYQISADLNPHDKIIWQRLGFSLISCNKYEQAEKSFENADKIQPNNTDTFTGWGMAFMKQEKFAQAREKFQKAAKFNKYNFSAIFLCAVMEIKLEMYDIAETKLAFLANVAPNENNTFEYARLKALKDDYEGAIHYAKKSLDFNPNMLSAYIILGQVYAFIYDKENSLKYFTLAEEKGLSNSNLYLEWGKALEKFGNFEQALEMLKKALEEDNEDVEVLSHMGLCLVSKKQFDEANPLLEKVLEKEPENKIIKKALGILKYETNDIQNALSYFRCDDEDAVNCYYLAKCYEKLNNYTKVRDYYEAAVRINTNNMDYYIDYAKYLISVNDFADAQRKLRKALKTDDNNIVLLNLLFYSSYILVKENICEYNIKEAVTIAEKIESINTDLFEYPEQKAELTQILQSMKEK